MIPDISSVEQEVMLVPDWTINRVAGELGAIRMDEPERRKYGTCLTLMLKPSEYSLPAGIVAHRADAFCLLEADLPLHRTLGARVISDGIDVSRIQHWLSLCAARHDNQCLPVATNELSSIRLIDVLSRQVVRYVSDCSYLALSYVWGETIQTTYKLGDTVAELPLTLEDAITLTRELGVQYLWIDSVCIDQSNPEDKSDQINRMWSIYRTAQLTLIVLSGASANAGISKISRQVQRSQAVYQIGDKTIASLAPTLSMQIWSSPWGQRAWTLQEGLLSPRCLYISDEQCYFDCSSMQCCESLDETSSWAHSLTPASNPTDEGFVTWMLRQAGAGALRIPLDWPSRRLEHWGEKLNLYSYRNMKFDEDAIRAFAGVLQRLETIYPQGFFCGLPREDFDWALLWRAQIPQERRVGFPTWSWAGWRGPQFFGQPQDVTQTRRIHTPFLVEGVEDGQVQTIFDSVVAQRQSVAMKHKIDNDLVERISRNTAIPMRLTASSIDLLAHKDAIRVTAVNVDFIPDFRHPLTGTYQAGAYETFVMNIGDVRCYLSITSTDSCVLGRWLRDGWTLLPSHGEQWSCLLVGRDKTQNFMLHHFLLIEAVPESLTYRRRTVFELLVPLDELEVLGRLNLAHSQVLLV